MLRQSPARAEGRLLATGATLTVLGIAMSTGELGTVAGMLTVGGLLTILVGLHRFGRTGPDGPALHPAQAKLQKPKTKRSKRTRAAPPR